MFRLFRAVGSDCCLTSRIPGINAIANRWSILRTLASQTVPHKQRRWTVEEKESLIKLREAGATANYISIQLGRSFKSVSCYVERLRSKGIISSSPNRKPAVIWTPEEDSRLLAATQETQSWDRIAKSFPGRTAQSLQDHFAELSRRTSSPIPNRSGYFTEEEDARLLYYHRYERLSLHQTALLLSRPSRSVYARLRSIKNVQIDHLSPASKAAAAEYNRLKSSGTLPKGFHGFGRHWTREEISQCLGMAAAGVDRREIASRLNRPPGSIHSRIWTARQASYDPKPPRWWAEEEKSRLLAMHASGITRANIAKRLSRSQVAVQYQYYRMTGHTMVQAAKAKAKAKKLQVK